MGSDEDMAVGFQPILSSNGQRTAEPSGAFTPGPWFVYQHFATPRPDLFDVCGRTRDDDVAENCTEANARLIAAAPDLYEALTATTAQLERVLNLMGLHHDDVAEIVLYRGKDALAKAAPPPQGVNATGAEAFPDNHLNEGD